MASDPVRQSGSIQFGKDFDLDPRSYELSSGGRIVKLERIPMELLILLIEERGQLVTRSQIIERIWGKDVFLDTDNSINAAIRKIRQVLKDDETGIDIDLDEGPEQQIIGDVSDELAAQDETLQALYGVFQGRGRGVNADWFAAITGTTRRRSSFSIAA